MNASKICSRGMLVLAAPVGLLRNLAPRVIALKGGRSRPVSPKIRDSCDVWRTKAVRAGFEVVTGMNTDTIIPRESGSEWYGAVLRIRNC